jgi:DNA-binding CsgD family transcriptional regulator
MSAPVSGRVFAVEITDELRGIVREPTALFFSILMPVAFFALFVSIFGGHSSGGTHVGTSMLATFGTYGVLTVTLMNPGITVAQDRERGWLRAKRVSAVPVGVTLAAKVVAALPYAVGVLLAMAATAAWDHADPLTDRERELLREVAGGASNADIARSLHLAEGTVRNYLSTAMAKLGARNRTEAVKTARDHGWI